MKKVLIAVFLTVFLSFNTYFVSAQDGNKPFTKGQFAYILTNILNVKLPPGTDALSAGEAYNVISNELMEKKGIKYFVGSKESETITYADMAEVLYSALNIKEDRDKYAKMKFLIDSNYLPKCDADSLVLLTDAKKILSNPAFRTDFKAEGYQSPKKNNEVEAVAEPYEAPANETETREPVGIVADQIVSQI